jgi:hypothetical protein
VTNELRISDIAPLVSAAAILVSLAWFMIRFRNIQRDRFVAVTNTLFQIWQSPDFMKAQLWIIRELAEPSWDAFLRHQGGTDQEVSFLRVTGFYNRVGTLVTLGLVDGKTILRTIGGTAHAVWKKTAPLVQAARQSQPGFLQDFERLIPHCEACAAESGAESVSNASA